MLLNFQESLIDARFFNDTNGWLMYPSCRIDSEFEDSGYFPTFGLRQIITFALMYGP